MARGRCGRSVQPWCKVRVVEYTRMGRMRTGMAAAVATAALAGGVATGADAVIGGTPAGSAGSTAFLGNCTGTLIAPSVVLTAAACVTGSPQASVTLGRRDRTDVSGGEDHISIRNVISPLRAGAVHDLAIVDLGRESAAPVSAVAGAAPAVGATGTLRGFGRTVTNDGTAPYATVLQEASVKMVTCPASVPAGTFCSDYAASGSRGFCGGDQGAPLLVGATVVGIVQSGTLGCAGRTYYTDLAQNLAFVDTALGGRIGGRAFDAATAQARAALGWSPDQARIAGALPGATIRALHQDGTVARTTTAGPDGSFTMPMVAGTYDVQVTADGYVGFEQQDLVVAGPRAVDAGLTLPPGAGAPSVPAPGDGDDGDGDGGGDEGDDGSGGSGGGAVGGGRGSTPPAVAAVPAVTVTSAARRRDGRLTVRLRVRTLPRPATLVVTASLPGKHPIRAARRTAKVKRIGAVTLLLTPARAVRRNVAKARRLQVTVSVGGVRATRRTVTLKRR